MSIQEILTHSIEFVVAAHFALSLVNVMSRRRISPGQLSLFSDTELLTQCQAEAEADPGFLAEIQPQPVAVVELVDRVVPFVRPVRKQQAIDWASLAPVELRKLCQQRSIKWRNAHGKNRHLSKREMVEALSLAATA